MIVKTNIRVELCDVDIMHIVWHGNYLRYLEAARGDYLQAMGLSYDVMQETGYVFPITKMSLKYIRSAKLRDELTIETTRTPCDNKIIFHYRIYNAAHEVICKAESDQMCICSKTGETMYEIPDAIVALMKDQ